MCMVIGEIGINANGDVGIAKQLIDVAKDAGCDAIKFQKRTVEKVYTKEFLDSPRESPWGKTQRDQKNGLEFGTREYQEIDEYCRSLKIPWFASAWDMKSLEFLKEFNCKYNKVASAMLAYPEFLEAVARQYRYTFISTGMSDINMLDRAVRIFRNVGCPFELMHCVSVYPCPDDKVNLSRIRTLRERYRCRVGYSGHEVGVAISVAAAGMGITSLERHITLDRTMYGSDQAASLEPNGLRQLVESVRKVEKALGDGRIEMDAIEAPVAAKLRERETL